MKYLPVNVRVGRQENIINKNAADSDTAIANIED
jgi:hypothetical protein